MPTITLQHVTKYYKSDGRKVPAVQDVDLTIQQGEFVFLTGSSGAGKSTLLSLMAGKVKPDRGRVCLDGKDVARIPKWRQQRNLLKFGQVWQEPSLVRRQTVEENLELVGLIGAPEQPGPSHSVENRVRKVIGLVGMQGYEKKYPVELSSGETRRVELARAMINSPPILLLDEITANLDDDNIWDMFHLLTEINRGGTTVVMATHASQYVNLLRRRVVTLVDGHILGDVSKGRYGEIM
ncbi:MAG: ATP-binding cassette domain-containing protein [Oscillospiraceae bacterium]|nr:ATP-binding cassette domain-containing protein [Oscillospiraceae bacterium]